MCSSFCSFDVFFPEKFFIFSAKSDFWIGLQSLQLGLKLLSLRKAV